MIYNSSAPLKDGNPIAALQQRNLKGGYAMRNYSTTVPVEYLRELFDYNSETGVIRWKVARGPIRPGRELTRVSTSGYGKVNVDGKTLLAHRVAWAIYHGAWPTLDIDHIDGDRRNNAISNLRQATRTENCQNVVTTKRKSAGGQGVWWDKIRQRWRAVIWVAGKSILLGRFKTKEEAAQAYLKGKAKHHPTANLRRMQSSA